MAGQKGKGPPPSHMPEVGFEFGVVSAQVVQFLVGLQCFRRQAESGIVESEQLCNSHMAVGAGQIQRTMTHVILHREREREKNKGGGATTL